MKCAKIIYIIKWFILGIGMEFYKNLNRILTLKADLCLK